MYLCPPGGKTISVENDVIRKGNMKLLVWLHFQENTAETWAVLSSRATVPFTLSYQLQNWVINIYNAISKSSKLFLIPCNLSMQIWHCCCEKGGMCWMNILSRIQMTWPWKVWSFLQLMGRICSNSIRLWSGRAQCGIF